MKYQYLYCKIPIWQPQILTHKKFCWFYSHTQVNQASLYKFARKLTVLLRNKVWKTLLVVLCCACVLLASLVHTSQRTLWANCQDGGKWLLRWPTCRRLLSQCNKGNKCLHATAFEAVWSYILLMEETLKAKRRWDSCCYLC